LQTREVFGAQGRFLCDFFHVSEYLAAAAQTCKPGTADRWRRTQQARLKRGALEKVIDTLVPQEAADTPEETAPMQGAPLFDKQGRLPGLSARCDWACPSDQE
jgi:hypothetical protein